MQTLGNQTAIISQLKTILANLGNKKLLKNIKNEINSLINSSGPEGQKQLFICLFQSLNLKLPTSQIQLNPTQSPSDKQQNLKKQQYLVEQFQLYGQTTPFINYFATVIEEVFGSTTQKVYDLVKDIAKQLNISIQIQTSISLSLVFSMNTHFQKEGIKLLKNIFREYYETKQIIKLQPLVFHTLTNYLQNNQDFTDMKEEINLQLQTSDLSFFDQLQLHSICPLFTTNSQIFNKCNSINLNSQPIQQKFQNSLYPKPSEFMEELLFLPNFHSDIIWKIFSFAPQKASEEMFNCVLTLCNSYSCCEDQKATRIANNLFFYTSQSQKHNF